MILSGIQQQGIFTHTALMHNKIILDERGDFNYSEQVDCGFTEFSGNAYVLLGISMESIHE
jgi:hypothetical protein